MATLSVVSFLAYDLRQRRILAVRAYTFAFCAVLALVAAVSPIRGSEEAQSEGRLFGELAREQSLSESYVGLLKKFSNKDANTYAEGIRLYAVAKANFDGLIEQLKTDLSAGRELDQSEAYQTALKTAVEHRVAFTKHIDEKIIGDKTGKRSGIVAVITTVADLLPVFTEFGQKIWMAYQGAQNERRKELLDHLDALKWKPFHEIRKTP